MGHKSKIFDTNIPSWKFSFLKNQSLQSTTSYQSTFALTWLEIKSKWEAKKFQKKPPWRLPLWNKDQETKDYSSKTFGQIKLIWSTKSKTKIRREQLARIPSMF